MPGRFHFEPETRPGPCLQGCREIAIYELTCPDPRRWRASCPACGAYEASDDSVEDACHAWDPAISIDPVGGS
jgi:hypothetical protein